MLKNNPHNLMKVVVLADIFECHEFLEGFLNSMIDETNLELLESLINTSINNHYSNVKMLQLIMVANPKFESAMKNFFTENKSNASLRELLKKYLTYATLNIVDCTDKLKNYPSKLQPGLLQKSIQTLEKLLTWDCVIDCELEGINISKDDKRPIEVFCKTLAYGFTKDETEFPVKLVILSNPILFEAYTQTAFARICESNPDYQRIDQSNYTLTKQKPEFNAIIEKFLGLYVPYLERQGNAALLDFYAPGLVRFEPKCNII
jgi:hypothetical protein